MTNMHDKLVNTCIQTTHMHVTTREASQPNTHSILHNTHAHSYIIRHIHIFLPSVARTCPSEVNCFPSPTFCSSIQEVLVHNCANASKHRYTQTASTQDWSFYSSDAYHNKGRGLAVKHAWQASKRMYSDSTPACYNKWGLAIKHAQYFAQHTCSLIHHKTQTGIRTVRS